MAFRSTLHGTPTTAPSHLAGRLRWENRSAGRYYEAVLQRDLFGDWEVWRCWGSIGSPRAGQMSEPAAGEQAGQAALARLASRRQRRGYALTSRRSE